MRRCVFLAQTKGRREKERERKRKGKEEERERRKGKEKGKGGVCDFFRFCQSFTSKLLLLLLLLIVCTCSLLVCFVAAVLVPVLDVLFGCLLKCLHQVKGPASLGGVIHALTQPAELLMHRARLCSTYDD